MRSVDYQIWRITKNGSLVEYIEGAINGTWTKKTAMREFKAKYYGVRAPPGAEWWRGYAVVEVRSRVIAK